MRHERNAPVAEGQTHSVLEAEHIRAGSSPAGGTIKRRWRGDVLHDLDRARRDLAYNERRARETDDPGIAALADNLVRSARRRIAALEAELPHAEERAELRRGGPAPFVLRFRTTPMTAAESDALAIPAFLRRDENNVPAFARGQDQKA